MISILNYITDLSTIAQKSIYWEEVFTLDFHIHLSNFQDIIFIDASSIQIVLLNISKMYILSNTILKTLPNYT